MTMVTASVGSEPRAGGGTQSVWRELLDAVVEPQPRNAEHEIIEYLYRHRYDYRLRSGLNLSVATSAPKCGL